MFPYLFLIFHDFWISGPIINGLYWPINGLILSIYFLKYFRGDEDCKMINFPLIKCTKAWIGISYLSKNMKWNFDNMYQISSENIKHFLKPRNLVYSQGRESSNIK